MVTRATLYAHAIRNTIGRTFGAVSAYTPAQRATAQILWNTFAAAGYDDDTCAALLGNTDGETSFLLSARGDHNEAGGLAQWHGARQKLILQHTGIDVWTAGAQDQARALIAEMTQAWSWYHHVDAALRAAKTIQAKIAVLVVLLEQSGAQTRDIARRTPMAVYWREQFGKTPVA